MSEDFYQRDRDGGDDEPVPYRLVEDIAEFFMDMADVPRQHDKMLVAVTDLDALIKAGQSDREVISQASSALVRIIADTSKYDTSPFAGPRLKPMEVIQQLVRVLQILHPAARETVDMIYTDVITKSAENAETAAKTAGKNDISRKDD